MCYCGHHGGHRFEKHPAMHVVATAVHCSSMERCFGAFVAFVAVRI
jgi:hypothetical protein